MRLAITFFLICYCCIALSQNALLKDLEVPALVEKLDSAKSDLEKAGIMKTISAKLIFEDPDRSKDYAEKCLRLSRQIHEKGIEAEASLNLGTLCYNSADFKKATEYFLASLELARELDQKLLMSQAYSNLANVNIRLGNFQEAEERLTLAIKLKNELNTNVGIANCYNSRALIFYSRNDFENAVANFEKSLNAARITGEKHIEAAARNGLAAIHFKNEEYEKALEQYEFALDNFSSLEGHQRSLSAVYHNIAQCHRKTGYFEEAIAALNKSIEFAKEINSNDDIYKAHKELNLIYKEQGDLANALIALEYSLAYRDSALDENIINSINELQERYKATERKREIDELQKENATLSTESTLRMSLLVVSILGLFLILLFALIYIRLLRLRQNKKQLELEQKALRAQMTPHFIFNSLNSIQRMYIEGKEDLANDYMADFSRLLRGILENSGKEAIRLRDELEIARLYLELERLRTDYLFDYEFVLDEAVVPSMVKVPPLIFQPYLENAIWHGIIPKNEKGHISIKIRPKNEKYLICEVIDDGVGFGAARPKNHPFKKTSKGMAITAERLGGANNTKVESMAEGGTKITLTVHCKK